MTTMTVCGPNCNAIVPAGTKCPKCRRPSAALRGYDRRWVIRRAEQLKRDPWCNECRRNGKLVRASRADHVEPHGGDRASFERGRLQSLCETCHNRKTALGG